jgi:hypothetical protein
MTFIGPLMMYNNFSVTVYGALDHVHIFSDFPLGGSVGLSLASVIMRLLSLKSETLL